MCAGLKQGPTYSQYVILDPLFRSGSGRKRDDIRKTTDHWITTACGMDQSETQKAGLGLLRRPRAPARLPGSDQRTCAFRIGPFRLQRRYVVIE